MDAETSEPVVGTRQQHQIIFDKLELKVVPFDGYDPARGDPLPHVPAELVWDYTGPLDSVVWRLRRLASCFPRLGTEPRTLALYMNYRHEPRFGIPHGAWTVIEFWADVYRRMGKLRVLNDGRWEATNDPWTID